MGIRAPQIYFSRPTKVDIGSAPPRASASGHHTRATTMRLTAWCLVLAVLCAQIRAIDAFGPRPRPRLYAKVRVHLPRLAPLKSCRRSRSTDPFPPSTRRSRTFPRISSPPSARSGSSRRADRPPPACSATGYGRRPARTKSRSRHHSWTAPKPPTDRASRPRPATRPRWDRAWTRHPRPRTRRP